jgi:hypothetical protein
MLAFIISSVRKGFQISLRSMNLAGFFRYNSEWLIKTGWPGGQNPLDKFWMD